MVMLGDGLDSNGEAIISGGNLEIWGAKSGSDGDPIDRIGKLSISDATFLAGGNQGMSSIHQSSTINQQFIYTTQSFSSNKQITIQNGETIIKAINFPNNVGYIFYTSKDITSNYKFSEGQTYQNNGQNSNNNKIFPPNQNQNSDMPNNYPSNPNQNSDIPNNLPLIQIKIQLYLIIYRLIQIKIQIYLIIYHLIQVKILICLIIYHLIQVRAMKMIIDLFWLILELIWRSMDIFYWF